MGSQEKEAECRGSRMLILTWWAPAPATTPPSSDTMATRGPPPPALPSPPLRARPSVLGFANSQPLAASGVKVAGVKYMFLRCDGRTILGKKGTSGVHCVKTGKAVLVVVYDQPITAGQCSVVVEKLADYLIGVGF